METYNNYPQSVNGDRVITTQFDPLPNYNISSDK